MSAKQGKEAAAPAAPASPSPARTLPFQILRNHRQPPADLAPPQERIFASESFRETMCTLIGSPAPSVRKIKKERRGKKYSTASQQKRQIASRFAGLAEDSEERDGESASLWRWLWEPELESFRREGELELLAIFGRPLSPAQQEEEEAFRKQEEREMMPPAASFLPPAEAPHEVLPVISSGPEKNEVEEEHELFFYSALGYHQIESYNPRNQQSEDQFFNHAAGNHDFN